MYKYHQFCNLEKALPCAYKCQGNEEGSRTNTYGAGSKPADDAQKVIALSHRQIKQIIGNDSGGCHIECIDPRLVNPPNWNRSA